jgi:hypothetical protein
MRGSIAGAIVFANVPDPVRALVAFAHDYSWDYNKKRVRGHTGRTIIFARDAIPLLDSIRSDTTLRKGGPWPHSNAD